EFGGFALHIRDRRFYPIQVAEKQLCSIRATLKGPGGHGAVPVRGGAMARLAEALSKLDRRRLPVHITPVVREMCRSIANETRFPTSTVMRQVPKPALTGAMVRLMGQAGHTFGPLLRNTVSPTILRASEKVNVIPSEVSLVMDGRLLP